MLKIMTKEGKDWIKQISITLLGVLCTLLIVAFTFKRDTKYTETKELKEKVIQLDKEKASTDYVDQRCLEVKSEIKSEQFEIKSNLRDLNRKTDKILELMITEKKK